VFDDQRKKHGLTQKAVEETIRICKDRNILRNYLGSKEMEVVTIMMSLFDEEQIMKIYVKDMQNEAAKEADKKTAKRMILKGRMTLEEIAEYVPNLSMDELRELEAEVLALA
jgi:translation initiation factor 2 beta subunit (eIF-2beta)/eIF-5